MTRYLTAIIFGLAALAPAAPAAAATHDAWSRQVTVSDLAHACGGANQQLQAYCLGYIAGLLEFRAAYDAAYRTQQTYCLPPAVTVFEVKQQFVTWAEGNRGKAAAGALWGISRSMNEMFPC